MVASAAVGARGSAADDWQAQVGEALGKTGAAALGGIYHVGLPRPDLQLTLDDVELKPGFALCRWLAFEKTGEGGMVMGDLVLTMDEVAPVTTKLAAGGIDVTALHNHLLRNQPFTMYMLVLGHGDPVKLARGLHAALGESETPLASPASSAAPPPIDLDAAAIGETLCAKGTNNGGTPMGSPNPMWSGVALARRLAEHLVAPLDPPALEAGFQWLFDGTQASLANWQQAGPGNFDYDANEKVIVARPGGDIGLFFFAGRGFSDFTLRLQFRLDSRDDNSGVFVRSRDPRQLPPAGLNDPRIAGNPAWLAVDTGFEIQIDEMAQPDQADMHRTGAVYAIPIGAGPGQQIYARGPALQPGEWNDYEIQVAGDTYDVRLNGFQTAHFSNNDPARGRPANLDPLSGYIGVQTHTGAVSFRAIRIKG